MKFKRIGDIRTFTHKDSATRALRRVGVPVRRYKEFITKKNNKCYIVDVPYRMGSEVTKAMSTVIKDLVYEGLSNQEIFRALQQVFKDKVTENHKWYVRWVRCKMKREGFWNPTP